MLKIKALLLIFISSSSFSFAQNCNCESNYQWVKKHLRKMMPDFNM